MRRVGRMRDAPDVHELHHDLLVDVVDGVGDAPPARRLLVGVDAGSQQVALSVLGGLRASVMIIAFTSRWRVDDEAPSLRLGPLLRPRSGAGRDCARDPGP